MTLFLITAYFESKFAGRCRWCNSLYLQGETITFVDDQLLCVYCVYRAREFNEELEFMQNEHR